MMPHLKNETAPCSVNGTINASFKFVQKLLSDTLHFLDLL